MNEDRRSSLRTALCRLPYWAPVGLGLVAVLLALSGGGFGLAADRRWGEVRVITLIGGGVVVLLAAADQALKALDRRMAPKGRERAAQASSPEQDRATDAQRWAPGRRRWALIAFVCATIAVYLGLATVWNFPRWPPSTHLYHLQAQAFARGETAVDIEPAPGLAELSNPYDPQQRKGIRVAGDFSYYDGRYYMYWGPAPAALSALWLRAGGGPVSDAVLVFLSVTLLFVFSSLTVVHLQNRFFPAAPPWLVISSLVLVAVAHPMLWTLNSPSVFTAAVSAGQAFFMGGLYFMITGLTQPGSAGWRGLLSGSLWALAIASRLTLLVVVGPLVLIAIALHLRHPRRSSGRGAIPVLISLLAPLVLGLVALGAFNAARFDDPLQTGFAYQMVSSDQARDLRQGLVFNPRYLLPHLLYDLAAPIRLVPEFPFVRPWWKAYPPFELFFKRFTFIWTPSVQNAAGVLVVTPALALGGIEVVRALSCGPGKREDSPPEDSGAATPASRRHVTLVLLVGVIAAAGPTLLYRVSAARFFLEFVPPAALLAALGAFGLHQASRGLPARRAAVHTLIATTIVVSAAIGFLLALNGAASRFDDANPDLYWFLVEFFSR